MLIHVPALILVVLAMLIHVLVLNLVVQAMLIHVLVLNLVALAIPVPNLNLVAQAMKILAPANLIFHLYPTRANVEREILEVLESEFKATLKAIEKHNLVNGLICVLFSTELTLEERNKIFSSVAGL
jgi:hypothetical protein